VFIDVLKVVEITDFKQTFFEFMLFFISSKCILPGSDEHSIELHKTQWNFLLIASLKASLELLN
jgi:hypothetical protein